MLALGALLAVPGCAQGTACVDLAASELSDDGRTYAAVGHLTRFPADGPALGTGTRPVSCCGNEPRSARVEVSELRGEPPQEAVLVGDELYVAGPVPGRLHALTRPVACATRGMFTLTGAWHDTEPRSEQDGPPFDILFVTGTGSGVASYDRAELAVRVTRGTVLPGRQERARLEATGVATTVRVRCRGAQFRAEAVS